GAGEVPLRRAVLRVEALEVHTVVDDRETLARDAVEVGDLRRAAAGDRDDVRSRREHAPLELEHDAVEQRATPPRIAHALEVGPVATLPRPLDAAVEDEGARDDEKLHAERRRSMRGNRVARAARKLYRSSQRRRARAPSSLASAGCSSRRRIAAASPRGSPGATTRPQPSRISGIIETAVETIGRPSAIASKSLAGTCPTVSVVARWGTATTSAATR